MTDSVLWRRLDAPGHDACRLKESDSGWRLEGTAVFQEEGPACLAYQLECDPEWRTKAGRVHGWIEGQSAQFAIVRTATGLWTLNGDAVPGPKDTGVDGLPEALLSVGLADRLYARQAGRVAPPPYDGRRDPETGLLNTQAITSYSTMLADAVGEVLNLSEFPLVLGGDCSILLGSMLALRRRGRFGLFFADGHADFYQPEANVNGEVASSELALATGRGPGLLTSFEDQDRLLRDEDVVVFGYRDAAEQQEYGSQPLPPSMLALYMAAVRHLGVADAAGQAMEHLKSHELDGVWLHLDADVLNDLLV